jgi:HPt (histidine-containing phosphotransfer) domain-containing protein
MNDYVSKPIRVEELVEALSRRRPGGDGESAAAPPSEIYSPPAPDNRGGNHQSQAAGEGPLDPVALERLRELVGGEALLLAELIDSFLEDTPPLLAKLRAALEQKDTAGLRLASHTLKSSSRDFGALKLSELCRNLEARAKAAELEGLEEQVLQVEREYTLVQAALETIRLNL